VDPATLLGMDVALGALLAMMLLEGSDPLAVFLLPPLILVFGATFGAVVATSTLADVRPIGSWFRKAFTADPTTDRAQAVALLVDLATTIGIIGTAVGLIQVMQRLQDPDTLGPLIAVAFVATLWGVLSANFSGSR
jgi:flagellar motor component MotA